MIYMLEHLSSKNGDDQPCHRWVQYAFCGKREVLLKICQGQRHPEKWRVTVWGAGTAEKQSAA